MSVRYLLPCSCGKSVPVSASQAGGSVRCECGAALEAPRLRELRELPTEGPAVRQSSAWGFRQGLLSAGLLLAVVLVGGAGWFAATEPEPPAPFDTEARLEQAELGVQQMTPVQMWNLLHTVFIPTAEKGFERAESPQDQYTLQQIATSRLYRDALLIAAGVVLGLTVVLFAISPKSPGASAN